MSAAAAAALFPQDHNLDWLDELGRAVASAALLTPSAREALIDVLSSFAREDGGLPRDAVLALAALADPVAAPSAEPAQDDVVHALRLRLAAVTAR